MLTLLFVSNGTICVLYLILVKIFEIVLKLGSRFFIAAKLLGGPLKRNLPKKSEEVYAICRLFEVALEILNRINKNVCAPLPVFWGMSRVVRSNETVL